MKRTPWFPYNIKPVRVGVYEVFSEGFYAYWNGKRWSWASGSLKLAHARKQTSGASQFKSWRGLVKKGGAA
jgi:hypothetical protein